MRPPIRRPPVVLGKRQPLPTRQLKPSEQVLQKLLRANKRNLVGRPLHTALRQRDGLPGAGMTAAQAGWLTGLVAGAALLAAGISTSAAGMTGIGAAVALAAGVGLMLARRAQSFGGISESSLEPDVRSLDAYLDQVSPVLPQSALQRITRIKETLARVLPVLRGAQQRGDLPAEELFFAEEMVRRYLPDACKHYAALVATAQGDVQVAEDRTAEESLNNQLDVLHARLARVLDVIVQGEATRLANHEAFIRTKK